MPNDKFLARFRELQDKSDTMPITRGNSNVWIERKHWFSWATDCQMLIRAVFGETSPYYKNLVHDIEKCNDAIYRVESIKSIFFSAKEAYEGGYVFDIDRTISGELLGDFVVLAKQALAEGCKDVAAVLAAVALEDTLKRYAKINGLDVEEKDMSQVINALKSEGLVSGARAQLLRPMPNLRNFALHADWDKITEPEVNSMIGFVEQFLLKEFSP